MFNHTLKLDLGTDRHLIVGDLHGRYDQFMRLLELANYDPASDVLYSVGDLIDRGPKSVECVEWFENHERCYAIKGNHEHMMMDGEWFATWLSNGGRACLESLSENDRDMAWLHDILVNWPWVIDVGEDDEEHAFRIIHAEMPPGWPESYFQDMLNYATNPNDPSFQRCVWSRKLIRHAASNIANGRPVDEGVEFNLDRHRTVFVGHTPCKEAFSCGDHWFLDTWGGKVQTLIDATTKETWTVDIAWTPDYHSEFK